jgi:hypothetical protein
MYWGPKLTLKGNFVGRRPARKLKNTLDEQVRKDAAKLLNMKNWHTAVGYRTGGGKHGGHGHKIGPVPQQEGGGGGRMRRRREEEEEGGGGGRRRREEEEEEGGGAGGMYKGG